MAAVDFAHLSIFAIFTVTINIFIATTGKQKCINNYIWLCTIISFVMNSTGPHHLSFQKGKFSNSLIRPPNCSVCSSGTLACTNTNKSLNQFCKKQDSFVLMPSLVTLMHITLKRPLDPSLTCTTMPYTNYSLAVLRRTMWWLHKHLWGVSNSLAFLFLWCHNTKGTNG